MQKYKSLLGACGLALVATSMLSGCSFLKNSEPPRYNHVAGGKRVPPLNPGGIGYQGGLANAVKAPPMTQQMAPQPAPVPMAQPQADILSHQLQMKDLKNPMSAEFIDPATAAVLGESVNLAAAAPTAPVTVVPVAAPVAPIAAPVSVADGEYLALANVPTTPIAAPAAVQRNVEDLKRELEASHQAAIQLNAPEPIAMPVAVPIAAPVVAAAVEPVAMPVIEEYVEVPAVAAASVMPRLTATRNVPTGNTMSLAEIERQFSGSAAPTTAELAMPPSAILEAMPAPVPAPVVVATAPAPVVVATAPAPIIVEAAPAPMPAPAKEMISFPEVVASVPAPAPEAGFTMTAPGEWAAPTVAQEPIILTAPVDEPMVIEAPYEVVSDSPAVIADEPINLIPPSVAAARAGKFLPESRYSKRKRNMRRNKLLHAKANVE